jgi:hypothetical protein
MNVQKPVKHLRIRSATTRDLRSIIALANEAAERSKYRDIILLEDTEMRSSLISLMADAQSGRAFVAVAEEGSLPVHRVSGVIIAVAQPFYFASRQLEATDLFWYASPDASREAGRDLVKAMHKWAMEHPMISYVRHGTSNAIRDPEAVGRLLKSLGLKKVGDVYEMEV